MATIGNVTSGTVIGSARENQSTAEVNDSVKMANTGTQTLQGSVVVNGNLQVRRGATPSNRHVISGGGFGDTAMTIVVCTLAQYNANPRYSEELYFIKL